ncbi:MAG TPA: hypothetical protein DG761_05940 [Gammaproteobacteria bacterium]|jgi:phosphatidate cytidylyltransferase|nr:hypothetical protein [Acidiferrobacteraceae bacterium]MDP6552371.1 phosphatidate cytidylyltransferase [Arenicellales bacterium]MDP6790342.1 phosphatidate cytidylyltransferase [Arenicellales bacterium]MDP6918184.1 phosphatidate cytidylyltransferase [Arenicellales bacterium]HCX87546.1 hypothetical protein [Gammaproteobacteria bacterium]|tara:strand:+ start:36315 stop:37130 length:816 start_codon:yes stop_codon:yes gene_type:complete
MLRQRFVTAVVLGSAAIGAILFLPTEAVSGLAALIGFAAGAEWIALAHQDSKGSWRWFYGLIVAVGVLLSWKAFEFSDSLVVIAAVLWTLLLIWVAGKVWAGKAGRVPAHPGLGALILVPALGLAPYLHSKPIYGPGLLLTVLLVIWAGDIGAYLGGRRFGKTALAPTISPGKTREGASVGLIFAVPTGLASAYLFSVPIPSLWVLSGALIVVGIAGILADLLESMAKRSAGKKDSGSLLPGHGGVLDRIDSMLGAVPLYSGLSILFLGGH